MRKAHPLFCFTAAKEDAIIRIRKGKAKTNPEVPKERVNRQIRVSEVRLIDEEGRQVGVVSIRDALARAEAASLDLVEVSPKAEPPVCRILDFGKYHYQKERRAREARKKQHIVEIKEIKFGPSTEDHDYNFKKRNAVKFLKHHDKVKLTVRFRGRQLAHKELGYDLLNKLKDELKDIADLDHEIQQEARSISMIMAPKANIDILIVKWEEEHPEEE